MGSSPKASPKASRQQTRLATVKRGRFDGSQCPDPADSGLAAGYGWAEYDASFILYLGNNNASRIYDEAKPKSDRGLGSE